MSDADNSQGPGLPLQPAKFIVLAEDRLIRCETREEAVKAQEALPGPCLVYERVETSQTLRPEDVAKLFGSLGKNLGGSQVAGALIGGVFGFAAASFFSKRK